MHYGLFSVPLQPQISTEDGAIAQLVEQRTENPCVTGSIPVGTTLKIRELPTKVTLFFLWSNMAEMQGKTGKCFLQCFNRNDYSRCNLLQVQTPENRRITPKD